MKRLRPTIVARNVRGVIDDIGGRSVTAAHFDIKPWAVSKWYDSGRIPLARIKEVCRLANEKRGDEHWRLELLIRG